MSRPLPEEVFPDLEGLDVVRRQTTTPMEDEELRTCLRDFDGALVTLGDAFSAEVFDAVPAPTCRVLANFGVGYNHIDARAARAAGVIVTNTPGAVTDATADIAMTLMLMSARRAGEGERMVRAGAWEGWHPRQLLGLHLSGKTVGIVGLGRIGQAVARRCHHGFGMAVKYHGRGAKDVDFPAEFVPDLAALAGAVDVLVICVPGGAQTHHLIDAKVLAAMQPHAHLVNIARGDVVEEAALIQALTEKRICGAGLDVYEFEPRVPDALRALENVTLLPHLGTSALEVRIDMGRMAVRNLRAVLDGNAPLNPV